MDASFVDGLGVNDFATGSANSDILHEMLFSGWVPGDRVIDLGADGLSRSEGKDWGGYGLNFAMWQRVRDTAMAAGKTLTVDLVCLKQQ